MGDVHGAITALRTISLGPGANVEGDLRAPSIAIHPEARLRGRVSMSVDMPQSVSRTRREPAPAPGRW
jgi:cytoskeletal protein CcmA (bactofilin family)